MVRGDIVDAATQPTINGSSPGVSDSGSGIVAQLDTMARSPPVRDSKVEEVGGMVVPSLAGPTEEARPPHIAQTDSIVDLEKEAAQPPLPRFVTGTGQSPQASELSSPPPRQPSDSSAHPPAQNCLPSKRPKYHVKKRAFRPPPEHTDLTPAHKCVPGPDPASSKSTTSDPITRNLSSDPPNAIPALPSRPSGMAPAKTQESLPVEEARAAKRQRTSEVPIPSRNRLRRR